MHTLFKKGRLAGIAVGLFVTLAAASSLQAKDGVNEFVVRNLVSNGSVPGTTTDASLVNAWGLVASSTSPWWTSNNGTNTSTLYNGAGAKIPLTVAVDGGPTGIVFNGNASAFVLPGGTTAGRFLFAAEDGKLRGWNSGTTAVVTADRSSGGAVYKGLAIATLPDGTPRLYATDFHNGRVDMFDAGWQVVTIANALVDNKVPKGFAPFGIQTIGQRVFVTYAKQDAAKKDDVKGRALGWFSVYDLNGKLLSRVGPRGPLNAPWGLAMAPTSFGKFGGDLLVGNFGDGRISVYEERSNGKWAYRGSLRNGAAQPITIDGLWALEFGNGAAAGPTDSLFFTAGPNDEKAGVYGSITAA
jgi:uncharacterized protein (TIGR03118 family)